MIEFIIRHELLAYIICFVLFVIALIPLIKYRKTPAVKRFLYFLVAEAQKTFGSGTKDIKYAFVISKFYQQMPLIVRLIFSEKMIDSFITEQVIKLKEKLANGMNLTGY